LEYCAPAPSRSGRSFGRRLCIKPLLGDGKFIAEFAKKHAEYAASMRDAVEFDELKDLLHGSQRLPDLHHGFGPLSRRGLDWGDTVPAIVHGRSARTKMGVPVASVAVGKCYLTEIGQVRRVLEIKEAMVKYESPRSLSEY
jgi:hypothetical protein